MNEPCNIISELCYKGKILQNLFTYLFGLILLYHPSQQFFSHVGMGLSVG